MAARIGPSFRMLMRVGTFVVVASTVVAVLVHVQKSSSSVDSTKTSVELNDDGSVKHPD